MLLFALFAHFSYFFSDFRPHVCRPLRATHVVLNLLRIHISRLPGDGSLCERKQVRDGVIDYLLPALRHSFRTALTEHLEVLIVIGRITHILNSRRAFAVVAEASFSRLSPRKPLRNSPVTRTCFG